MDRVYFLAIALFLPQAIFGQGEIGTGTWRTHFNYTTAERIAIVGSRVYCTSQNGLFYYDTEDNSLNKLSKLNGLSDTGIGAMLYLQEQEMLVLGYKNGNMDFITKEGTENLSTIKNANFDNERKYIRHIIENNGFLYLSTGLGIVVVDLANRQVKESYRSIGPSGQEIWARQVVIFKDSIFVASDAGVLSAPFNASVNLVDFNSWILLDEDPFIPGGEIKGIVEFNDRLIAYNQEQVFEYDNGWSLHDFTPEIEIKNMNASENVLLICLENSLVKIEGDREQIFTEGISDPQFAVSSNGKLWIADQSRGLVLHEPGNVIKMYPNGPFSPSVFDFVSLRKSMIALGGGYDGLFNTENSDNGFYFFENGQWRNYNVHATRQQKTPEAKDLVNGSTFRGEIYMASFGDGILTWKQDDSFALIDENTGGTTLQNNNENELLIADVKADNNELWILNYGNVLALHKWDGANQWQAYDVGSAYPVRLENSIYGSKWMTIDPGRGGGIAVFDPETQQSRRLTTARGNGGLPSNEVTTVAEDLDGELWIGTASGLVFYPQPFLALENEDGTYYAFDATFPVVDNDIFLRDIRINDILVDPGNRKWIATDDGVWIAEGNGGRLLFSFNEGNSPLPSNKILKLAIVEETGEVFMATDRGVISFRADVSSPALDYQNVRIFPNPVYPRHSGTVTINGLKDRSVVKITDNSGRLVWETRSFGGTATWDTSTSSIDTGIFLIFSSDDEAADKYVGKVAVVR